MLKNTIKREDSSEARRVVNYLDEIMRPHFREVKIDLWLKEVAPSRELRKWFSHDPSRWKEFQKRYKEEFKKDEKKEALMELAEIADKGNLTLIYSAKDEEHNNTLAIKGFIDGLLKKPK